MNNTVLIYRMDTIKEDHRLGWAKKIYDDFKDLAHYRKLMHTPSEIMRLLQSNSLVSFFPLETHTNKKDNKWIGYIIGEEKQLQDGRYVFYLAYFFVEPSYRKLGLGSTMMMELEKYVSTKGLQYIVLTCSVGDIESYYRKRGYVTDPMLNQNMIDGYIVMLKYMS